MCKGVCPHILCITTRAPPPVGMQQNAKLSHPLFSKINANSVTCQAENALSELPNDCVCVCVRCEPHATQLPAGSNTHYPCGIVPPGDRLRLSAHCFLCAAVCVCVCVCVSVSVTLSFLCSHVQTFARGGASDSPRFPDVCVCVCVTDWLSLQPICACRSSLSCSLLPVCNAQLMRASGCRGRST